MKRFLIAAAAAISLLAVVGCSSPTDSSTTTTSNVSQWKIKGSVDGWAEHNLTISDTNANTLSFGLSGLYQDSPTALVYEFVLINPAGVEYKASGAAGSITTLTPGTGLVLGDSTVASPATKANVGFVAGFSSYTVTVDISTAAAPKVDLIAGSTVAPSITNAILLSKLQIKGDQFSQINGAAVAAWTPTNGTTSGNTMSWDLLVDSKTKNFGFNALEGFLKGATIDTTSLTATSSAATTAVSLLTSGNNAQFSNMTKADNVYTLTVTVDATKSVASGRYAASAKLKTLGTTNWAFTPWTSVYITGGDSALGSNGWTNAAITPVSGIATFTYTATQTAQTFDINNVGAWTAQYGFAQVDTTGSTIALSAGGGYGTDIAFTAVVGTSYTIKVDFTTTSFTANGKPTVTVQ